MPAPIAPRVLPIGPRRPEESRPRARAASAFLLGLLVAAIAACAGTPRGRALRLNREAATAYEQREVERAWRLLGEAVRMDPTLAEAWYNQAVIALEVSTTDKAIDLFHEAIHHAPDDTRIRSRLGMALLTRDRDDEARMQFLEALRSDPSFAAAWFGLGLVHERAGDRHAAARCYRKGLALQPDALAFWARLLLLNPSA